MPTQSFLPFVESPDGLAQDSLISNHASIPGPCSSMTPHTTYPEKAVLQSAGSAPLSCMFCDQTFTHQDELGPHVLTEHPTTFFEPTVLRVEAEFRIPGERPQPKPSGLLTEKEDVHSCVVCGQVSQDASELETHLKKHKDSFNYCCNVCGRRFREPWFLKNHMKMHMKPGVKSKAQQDLDTPVTINGVVQDPVSEPVVTAYKMCMVCGFFFPDQDSLVEHSKVHNREVELCKDRDQENMDDTTESSTKQAFFQGLNLLPGSGRKDMPPERSSKWIPQLDPYNTYQAWQLATKGKIAVSLINNKDISQEGSTDNDDCVSDKDEQNNIWSEGQGDKAGKEVLGKELRPQQQAVADQAELQPQRRSLMQKNKDQERPTTCKKCHKTFRTYHQLVLHSRVHKRKRVGEESPTSSVDGKLARVASVDPPEEGTEEGFEEAAMTENFATGEDNFERSKVRSKQCSYCGKSFRSSYYLTVHLRTHTGEKPYKCAYCDYAAAQKTSLKYHLDRRHKDKPYVEIPSRPVASIPSPNDGDPGQSDEHRAPNSSPVLVPGATSCTSETPEDRCDSAASEPDKLLVQMNAEYEKLIGKSAYTPTDNGTIKCPIPVNLKMEKEIKEENSEAPLNPSLKESPSIHASEAPRTALILFACSFCSYKTIYPEVVIIHKRLTHKDKSDGTKKNGYGGSLKPKRSTGCPPALDGKDVTPLLMIDGRFPRRTKSPTPQPAQPRGKTPTNPPHGPRRSQINPPVHETQRYRQNFDQHASQETSMFPELMMKPNMGSKYVMDRPAPLDRMGIGKSCYLTRGGFNWPSDAARLCLSSRFGSLPQMDFREPPNKMLKYSLSTGREADTSEKSGFRRPAGDGSNRLLISGVKTTSQRSCQSPMPEALVPLKTTSPPIGGSLDADWSMMNLLHPYAPNDLTSLYRSTSAAVSHGGLANTRAGGRTLLYQHLPTLPNLQRSDPSGPYPKQRYGPFDKTT